MPDGDGWLVAAPGGWLAGEEPLDQLEAWTPREVEPLLAAVEEAARRGLWALGYVAYEAGAAFDRALTVKAGRPWMPLAAFRLYARVTRVTEPPPATDDHVELTSDPPALADYAAAVACIKERIAAGATYQVNLTYPLTGRLHGSPRGLAANLLRRQPGYGALLETDAWAVVSASPELFFRREGSRLVCRPMKGTRRRGRWPAEDARLAEELWLSPKDRAENLMIVDMVRNDLGRVARTGSVAVTNLFTVERYPTVWQMTSTVEAQSRASLPQVFAALFPSASVTGAPKASTMAIIDALEPSPRGVYCGAVGYVGPGAEAQFNVAIRTAVIQPTTGHVVYHVGSGIVWDSDAAAEHAECRDKARILAPRPPAMELFETLLWEPETGWRLLDEHLDRLRFSAEALDLPVNWDGVRHALAAGQGPSPARCRLIVAAPDVVALESAALDPLPQPYRVTLAAQAVCSDDPRLYHKHGDRALYQEALAARPGYADVLLFNERGEVTETTRGNVVFERDGRRWTPPLNCGLLPGVFRQHLLDRGEIGEATLPVADLTPATRLWMVNSVRGWVEAVYAAP